MLLDIIDVKALADNYALLLEFENGEKRRFDRSEYLNQEPWIRLKANHLFQAASVENSTVTWPGNINIDPETLYELSIPL